MYVCMYVCMYVKFVSHGHERAQCTLYRAVILYDKMVKCMYVCVYIYVVFMYVCMYVCIYVCMYVWQDIGIND